MLGLEGILFASKVKHRETFTFLDWLLERNYVNEALELLELALRHDADDPWSMTSMLDMDATTWVLYAMLLAAKKDYAGALRKWRVGVMIDSSFCERHVDRLVQVHRHDGYSSVDDAQFEAFLGELVFSVVTRDVIDSIQTSACHNFE